MISATEPNATPHVPPELFSSASVWDSIASFEDSSSSLQILKNASNMSTIGDVCLEAADLVIDMSHVAMKGLTTFKQIANDYIQKPPKVGSAEFPGWTSSLRALQGCQPRIVKSFNVTSIVEDIEFVNYVISLQTSTTTGAVHVRDLIKHVGDLQKRSLKFLHASAKEDLLATSGACVASVAHKMLDGIRALATTPTTSLAQLLKPVTEIVKGISYYWSGTGKDCAAYVAFHDLLGEIASSRNLNNLATRAEEARYLNPSTLNEASTLNSKPLKPTPHTIHPKLQAKP